MSFASVQSVHDIPNPMLSSDAPARVLFVDDEEVIRELMRLKLLHRGVSCEVAANVAEAKSWLQRQTFDAVISDLWMPQATGLDLAEYMSRLFPYVPLVLMTGAGEVRTAVQAMKVGADDYLQKPIDDEQMMFSLKRAMHMRSMRRRLDEHQAHLERTVATRTAELQCALSELQQTWDATLEALGSALDYRDHETQGHSRRVAELSTQIAQALGIRGDLLKCIYQGAYLHDVGKIAIPDSILRKPGPLTPEERQIMQSHVELGYQIIKPIPFLKCAADIILAHHERFDGTGYPNGLAGEEIPIGARIFAVADTFDAMTSDRPYRKAGNQAAARAEILRCAGTQFDPVVASAFLNLPARALPEPSLDIPRTN
jgi:putative nucleotidyltransferase with HDIG domain